MRLSPLPLILRDRQQQLLFGLLRRLDLDLGPCTPATRGTRLPFGGKHLAKAAQSHSLLRHHVRYGSLADIDVCVINVCFAL